MKYSKAIGCVVILCATFFANANAASTNYSGELDLTDRQYPVSLGGLSGDAAANLVRFDLGSGLSGDMEILLTTSAFSAYTTLGFALTTDPNDTLYSDPSPFLDLLDPTANVTDFFNDNVTGWRFYLYGNSNIPPTGGTSNLTDIFNPMQFDPNLNYYAFIAGGSLVGETINLGLTVNDASPSANPVPVPAALWLFGSGIAGFIGLGRRKKTLA